MRAVPITLVFMGLCIHNEARPQPAPNSYNGPLHVELLKYLHVRHVRPGSTFFVRVTEDWRGLGCELRRGAIVEGRVEAATPRSQGARHSDLALSFSKAQCSGVEMAPIDLVLAAVCWNPKSDTLVPIMRVSDMGRGGTVRSMDFVSVGRSVPSPPLHPGEVFGIRGVKLEMGAGPQRSSVLSATNRDISFDRLTQFLLVPSSVAFLATPVSLASPGLAEAIAAAESSAPFALPFSPATIDEFESCSPPYCSADLPTSMEISGHPAKSISMLPLGYAPRPNREILELDNDAEVAWLGNDRLLIAFNPHRLVHRAGADSTAAPVRSIHAVLLDIKADQVLGTADWELPDESRFLWQISRNRLLIHAGNELRVYDDNLAPVWHQPLDGPLAFVRISPSGDFLSIGTIRERHTAELHDRLRESLESDPEEDINIVVLDKNFEVVTRAVAASNIMPPMLLNEGQLRLLARPNSQYRLAMLTWENQEMTLARFSSSCTPEISTFPPDLLLVRTCEKTGGSTAIRVLRPDGQLLMWGKPDPQELGQEADGSNISQTFLVRTMRAASAVHPGSAFHGSDLVAEELRVYRATDGKRLVSLHADSPAPSHGGYALSPDGSQLAVITGTQLKLYSVP